MIFADRQVVLASASPRRLEILRQIGIEPELHPVAVEEDNTLTAQRDEEAIVSANAARKAQAAAPAHADAIVIGADTIVAFEGAIFGKPANREDAKRMLEALSGNTHKVYTGICLIDTKSGKTVGGASVCEVTFPKLKEREIDEYLDSGEPFDKAGAYGIQGRGALLVDRIEGDYYTVVGLSVPLLRRLEIILQMVYREASALEEKRFFSRK